jgi:hypothetical protein
VRHDVKVVFATPTLDCKPAFELVGSMGRVATMLAQAGVQNAHIFWPGLQFVDSARNFLVKQFLEDFPNAEFMFFIDDDIGFPPEKVLEFLNRPEDIVAGVYPMKTDPAEYACFLCLGEDGQTLIERDGLHRATLVPGGFLRIRRKVLETLARKSETYTLPGRGGTLQVCFNVFDRGNRNPITGEKTGEFVGEDAWFCMRAMHEGFEIWVDTDIEFDHRGARRWTGRFRHHIAQVMSQLRPPAPVALPAPAEEIINAMPELQQQEAAQ